jgi:capsular exopolysaccharide synthesis family protein
VGKYLGISNAAGLTNVLAGQHELRDVLVSYQRDTLSVLPSGPTPPNPSEMLGSQQMRHLLATLAADYDVVIIDAPPLLPVTDAAVLAAAADGAIIVIRHGKSRREEVERATQALTAVNAKVLGTVLNFAPRKKRLGGYDGYGYGYGYGQAAAESVPRASRRQRKREVAAAAALASSTRPGSQGLPSVQSTVLPPLDVELPPHPQAPPRAEADRAPVMNAFGPPSDPFAPPTDLEATAERRAVQFPDEAPVAANLGGGTGVPRHHRSKRSS